MKKSQPSLRPVHTDHFKITKIENNCTLKGFCNKQGIQANRLNVFLELGATKKDETIRDVLLADKVCISSYCYSWRLVNIKDMLI